MKSVVIGLLALGFVSMILVRPGTSVSQQSEFTSLFLFEPGDEDGLYEMFYGTESGLKSEYRGNVYALYDSDRPLDDYIVGTAEISEFVEEYTEVSITFAAGFTPRPDESFLVEFPVKTPNPYIQSVPYEFTSFGITLLDLEDDTLLDQTMFVDDGLFAEHTVLDQLREHVVASTGVFRDLMDEPAIDEGRYEGRGMFDAMEASTLTDIRDFMLYVIDNPLQYMGKSWKFSEIYATWLMNGCPETESPRPFSGTPQIGFRIGDAGEDGYPMIESVSQASFGMTNDMILPGGRLLAINGESLFRESRTNAENLLQGDVFDLVEVSILSTDNAVVTMDVALLPLPETAGWITERPEDYSSRLYPIKNEDKKWGFIDSFGEEVIEPQYDDISSRFTNMPFAGGLEGVKVGDKWGFINLEGRMVISPRWVRVDPFIGGLAGFQHPDDEYLGGTGGRYGYIDRDGNEVIPATYDRAFFGGNFEGGLAGVRKDDDTGFIDKTGRLVIPFQYNFSDGYSEGLARVNEVKDGPYGYIDMSGDLIIPFRYKTANPFYNGMAVVQKDEGGKFEAIDKNGNTLIMFDITPNTTLFSKTKFTEGRLRGITENKKYGFMNEQGRTVIDPIYSDTEYYFSEGLVGVTETGRDPEVSIGSRIGGWYFIDRDGNTVIEGPFDEVSRFSEGVCWVKEEDGLWGLIDRSGEWLIEPEFDSSPLPFKDGLSRIHIRRDEGRMFPEEYYMYYRKEGYAAWRPFY